MNLPINPTANIKTESMNESLANVVEQGISFAEQLDEKVSSRAIFDESAATSVEVPEKIKSAMSKKTDAKVDQDEFDKFSLIPVEALNPFVALDRQIVPIESKIDNQTINLFEVSLAKVRGGVGQNEYELQSKFSLSNLVSDELPLAAQNINLECESTVFGAIAMQAFKGTDGLVQADYKARHLMERFDESSIKLDPHLDNLNASEFTSEFRGVSEVVSDEIQATTDHLLKMQFESMPVSEMGLEFAPRISELPMLSQQESSAMNQMHSLPKSTNAPLLIFDAKGQPQIGPSVGSEQWGYGLSQSLRWMIQGTNQTVSFNLNPPELGPMQVIVQLQNDLAYASFVSSQAEVRQALEQAVPKLREMMQEAGIQMGSINVGAGGAQQQQERARFYEPDNAYGKSLVRDVFEVLEKENLPKIERGQVDMFV